jgi:NAD-dependent DNA ligase
MKTLEQARRQFMQVPTPASDPTPVHEALADGDMEATGRTTLTEVKAGVPLLDAFDAAVDHVLVNKVEPLQNKTFAITGRLSRPRKEFQQLIADAGGVNQARVNAWVDILVVGDGGETHTKFKKAKEYHVECCSESDLLAMIRGE